jgi:glycosyltransferase involved in cell wall biosynthesis
LGFSQAPGIGAKKLDLLLRNFGSLEKAWRADYSKLIDVLKPALTQKFDEFRKQFNFGAYQLKLQKQKIKFICVCDQEYPPLLKQIPYPPIGLYVKGDLNVLNSARGPVSLYPRPMSSVDKLPAGTRRGSPALATPVQSESYYFIVSRIVGAKGLDLAVEAALKMGFRLKIAGSPAGYYSEHNQLLKKADGKVEFLGQVSDEELVELYKGAKGFLALSKDEDFGITPVESQSCGTPVVAFNGGGYKETVIDGKTGVLFNDYSIDGLITAIKRFEGIKFNQKDCVENAQKFSKERFKKEIQNFISSKMR